MSDSLSDLHDRIVAALKDADDLHLDDVGIALDKARLCLERRIVEMRMGLGVDPALRDTDRTAGPQC